MYTFERIKAKRLVPATPGKQLYIPLPDRALLTDLRIAYICWLLSVRMTYHALLIYFYTLTTG